MAAPDVAGVHSQVRDGDIPRGLLPASAAAAGLERRRDDEPALSAVGHSGRAGGRAALPLAGAGRNPPRRGVRRHR